MNEDIKIFCFNNKNNNNNNNIKKEIIIKQEKYSLDLIRSGKNFENCLYKIKNIIIEGFYFDDIKHEYYYIKNNKKNGIFIKLFENYYENYFYKKKENYKDNIFFINDRKYQIYYKYEEWNVNGRKIKNN
jgi:hypothetical protein